MTISKDAFSARDRHRGYLQRSWKYQWPLKTCDIIIPGSLVAGGAICYVSKALTPCKRKIYETYMHSDQIAYTGKLGPQQLKYPANIPPKPRPILKIPCLSCKYPAGFNKKHTQPTLQD